MLVEAAALAIIRHYKNEPQILTTRRKINPHVLTFPGGTCEDGEAPLDCALRETLEETGLCFLANQLATVDPVTTFRDKDRTIKFWLFHLFLQPNETVKPRNLLPRKHYPWKWTPLEQIIYASLTKSLPYRVPAISLLELIRSKHYEITGGLPRQCYFHPDEIPARMLLEGYPE